MMCRELAVKQGLSAETIHFLSKAGKLSYLIQFRGRLHPFECVYQHKILQALGRSLKALNSLPSYIPSRQAMLSSQESHVRSSRIVLLTISYIWNSEQLQRYGSSADCSTFCMRCCCKWQPVYSSRTPGLCPCVTAAHFAVGKTRAQHEQRKLLPGSPVRH